jgi:type II secretory ATPase GspE/PulE/Tfp pilus assembly ATPase PilB-like protein
MWQKTSAWSRRLQLAWSIVATQLGTTVEVLPVTPEIEQLAMKKRSAEEIKRVAEEQGMISLRGDGLAKVVGGLTSLQEVVRVIE